MKNTVFYKLSLVFLSLIMPLIATYQKASTISGSEKDYLLILVSYYTLLALFLAPYLINNYLYNKKDK